MSKSSKQSQSKIKLHAFLRFFLFLLLLFWPSYFYFDISKTKKLSDMNWGICYVYFALSLVWLNLVELCSAVRNSDCYIFKSDWCRSIQSNCPHPKNMEWIKNEMELSDIHIVVVGDEKCGKTNLISRSDFPLKCKWYHTQPFLSSLQVYQQHYPI